MNLNEDPTQSQLMQIIAKCDDNFNHALWVSKEGDVNIKAFKLDESAALWQIRTVGSFNLGVHLFQQGKEKLG